MNITFLFLHTILGRFAFNIEQLVYITPLTMTIHYKFSYVVHVKYKDAAYSIKKKILC